MGSEIQRFLDHLITRYGVGRILIAPFVAIGALAGAGIITTGAAPAIAVVCVVFVAVVFMSALVLQLRTTRELLEQRTIFVNYYAQILKRDVTFDSFAIEDWREEVRVTKNGNTVLEKWVTIKIGSNDINFVWSTVWTAYGVDDDNRRQFKAEARRINQDGSLGVRYDVTKIWVSNKVELFIHFGEFVTAHKQLRIWIRWEWPTYYKSLLDGGTATVQWLMRRHVKSVRSRMIFDKSCRIRDNFQISSYDDGIMPGQERMPDGSIEISVEYTDVPVGTRFGFMLDSKEVRH